MTDTSVTFRKFNHNATLTVGIHLSREYRIRKWIALALIKLATIVLGCGLKVDDQA